MAASPQEMMLARIELVEARLASEECSEEEKVLLQPKLEQLRTALVEINKLYETRLAEIQERNTKAMSDLQRLSARVERRASAAAAEKEAAEAKEKAEAAAKLEAEAKPKTTKKKSKKSPRAKGKKTSLLATDEDTQLLLGAVTSTIFVSNPSPVLETPFFFPSAPIELKPMVIESPYVPCATPECWDAHSHTGSMLLAAC